jgi:hypothetical protein
MPPGVVERKLGRGGAFRSIWGVRWAAQLDGKVARERLPATVECGGQAVARLRTSMAVAVSGAAQRPSDPMRDPVAVGRAAGVTGNRRFLSFRDGFRGTKPRRVASRFVSEFIGFLRQPRSKFLQPVPVTAGGGVG